MLKKQNNRKTHYITHEHAKPEQLIDNPNHKSDQSKSKRASANFLRKGARINVRISYNDLARLKRIAEASGIPYQTLVSNILHKFTKNYEEIAS